MTLSHEFALPILKEMYDDDNVRDTTNDKNPLLSIMPRVEQVGGSTLRVVPKYGRPETISSTFADSLTAAALESSKWGKFNVDFVSKHGLARIDGDTLARCDSKESFVTEIKDEIDSVLKGMANRRAKELVSAGYGDIGVVLDLSGSTVTVSARSTRGMGVGQKHVFANTINGALLASGDGLKVTNLDRQTGVITYDAGVSTISGLSVGDYIFNKGDRATAGSQDLQCITGIEGWIPPYGFDFSGDDFWGQNRSVDVQALAGLRMSRADGTPLEEVLIEADAEVNGEGGSLDHFVVSPDTFADIEKALGSRVRYQPASQGKVGFSSLLLVGQSGDITVVPDRWVPNNRIYGLELKSWKLYSKGPIVKVNDMDGLGNVIRLATADEIQAHIVSRLAQLVCVSPRHNINITI